MGIDINLTLNINKFDENELDLYFDPSIICDCVNI